MTLAEDGSQPVEYAIANGWLVEIWNEHTCGVGKSDPVHEPGCGMVPLEPIESILARADHSPLKAGEVQIRVTRERAKELIVLEADRDRLAQIVRDVEAECGFWLSRSGEARIRIQGDDVSKDCADTILAITREEKR